MEKKINKQKWGYKLFTIRILKLYPKFSKEQLDRMWIELDPFNRNRYYETAAIFIEQLASMNDVVVLTVEEMHNFKAEIANLNMWAQVGRKLYKEKTNV